MLHARHADRQTQNSTKERTGCTSSHAIHVEAGDQSRPSSLVSQHKSESGRGCKFGVVLVYWYVLMHIGLSDELSNFRSSSVQGGFREAGYGKGHSQMQWARVLERYLQSVKTVLQNKNWTYEVSNSVRSNTSEAGCRNRQAVGWTVARSGCWVGTGFACNIEHTRRT